MVEPSEKRPRFVYVEAVDTNTIDEIETPYDMLKVGARLSEERGTASAMVARTDTGTVLTPEGFSDVAFDVSLDGGVAAAARTLESSRRGGPVGVDYVSHHWPGAREQDPEHFENLLPPWPLPYTSGPEDPWARAALPQASLCDVLDVRVSADGSRTVWLEAFPGWGTGYGVWAEDRGSSIRRLVARLQGDTAVLADISLSPDGRWLLANNPKTDLIDLDTGHTARFGTGIRAACWYPYAGTSAVLVAVGDKDHPSELKVLDLADYSLNPLTPVDRRVDGLDAASDGAIAARFHGAPDWTDCVMVSDDEGRTFEPVAPPYGASGWRRRTTRPRWVERPSVTATGPVRLDPQFEEFLRSDTPMLQVSEEEVKLLVSKCIVRIGRGLQRLEEAPEEIGLVPEIRVATEIFSVLNPSRLGQAVEESTSRLMRIAARHEGDALRRFLAEVVALGRLAERAAAEPPRLQFQWRENP